MLSSARRTREADVVIAVLGDDDGVVAPLLQRLEGSVLRARHEDELIRLFAEVRPDLVVIHTATGADASNRLRDDPLMQDSLVLVVGESGAGLEGCGADAWVALPTSEREIRAAVALLLRVARAERAAREVRGLDEE